MLKNLRIKFVTVNMTIVTLMLVAIFAVLYVTTSHRMEFESFRGPKHEMNSQHPHEQEFDRRPEREIIDKDPELFNEFAEIAKKEALNNLIKSYLLVSVPIFGLFLIISIFLSNWMIKPVEETFKKQKQFISDASHELKTPLTVITTNTELLSEESGLSEDGVQFTKNILITANKMKGLVTSLLELAKNENPEKSGSFARVNLSDTISRACLPFEPLFFEKDLTFSTDITEAVFVNGQSDDLTRLVEILLDNAIKYSTPGGKVQLKLFHSGNNVTLSVENTGEEIPQAELELIFERFYRTNKARTGMESYGLGLALAKQIVTNHKGSIFATSESGTNTFTCIFPISQKR